MSRVLKPFHQKKIGRIMRIIACDPWFQTHRWTLWTGNHIIADRRIKRHYLPAMISINMTIIDGLIIFISGLVVSSMCIYHTQLSGQLLLFTSGHHCNHCYLSSWKGDSLDTCLHWFVYHRYKSQYFHDIKYTYLFCHILWTQHGHGDVIGFDLFNA